MIDDSRFETAWHTHGASILRYCRFEAGSPQAGEDIAAETFARLLQQGDRVPDTKVQAWLFTVARNLCRSYQRRSSRWLALLPHLGSTSETTLDPEYGTGVAELLGPLSCDERLAVYLRVIEDRPLAQVALITGKTEEAARKVVFRALQRLRSIALQENLAVSHRGGVEND